jgi:hypothetical protein
MRLHEFVGAILLFASAFNTAQTVPDQKLEVLTQVSNFEKAVLHGGDLASFFSAAARAKSQRQIAALGSQGFLKFEITDFNPSTDLVFQDQNHAKLTATIKWETRHEVASRSSTLALEREQGEWKFTDADFWVVHTVWVIPLILIGVAYGVGFVLVYWHANRQSWASVEAKSRWQLFAFLPFAPLFYFLRKPWAGGPPSAPLRL